jgi:hypothetical protein
MKRHHDETDSTVVDTPTPKRTKQPSEIVRGDRPIYRFFLIWKDGKGNTREVPARCLLDWGSTTFAISKRFVTAFDMPTIERTTAIESYDASGRRFEDNGKTRTHPLRFSFGNHCSDEVFEVMTMGDGMEVIVPYWWMQKHRASGVYDGTLRFNDCPSTCFHSLSPGWSITYNRDLINLPQSEVFTAGAVTPRTPTHCPHDDSHAATSRSDVAPIAISAITTGSIPLRELLRLPQTHLDFDYLKVHIYRVRPLRHCIPYGFTPAIDASTTQLTFPTIPAYHLTFSILAHQS